MTCKACGYVCHPEDGDDSFINIQGAFFIEDCWNGIKIITLYACPKCFTVIANI